MPFSEREPMEDLHKPIAARKLFMVLSPHSWSYAKVALRSLLANCEEDFELQLITDSKADKTFLSEAVAELAPAARHSCRFVAEDDLADAEASRFAHYPNLRAFRHGHPCWRKITDPVLMGRFGEELILLDPDLYFPNTFRFEATPANGLLLMWQRPNCLLPSPVVRAALAAQIPLARHVDIGVSHWRMSEDGAELDWVDWLLGKLGGGALPRAMHVEAIVWSAIAMKFGGGHLNPDAWACWHRTHGKRVLRKLGVSGNRILASEVWSGMKCFHAGGEAKWWLPDFVSSAADAAEKPAQANVEPTAFIPFVELTRARYEREQSAKSFAAGLGYQKLFGAGRP
jgi:hypothetical protein